MTDETNGAPTYVTLGEAAKRTGLSKTTLHRKIRSGEISVRERGADGAFRIDASELLRFMDALRVQRATSSGGTNGAAAGAPLETQLALQEERHARELAETKLALTERQLTDALADRDQWREQAQRLVLPGPKPERRGWWRRFREPAE